MAEPVSTSGSAIDRPTSEELDIEPDFLSELAERPTDYAIFAASDTLLTHVSHADTRPDLDGLINCPTLTPDTLGICDSTLDCPRLPVDGLCVGNPSTRVAAPSEASSTRFINERIGLTSCEMPSQNPDAGAAWPGHFEKINFRQ
jgi:hypothetical protein